MAFQNIIYERQNSISYVTLNRPEKLNALNGDLIAEFREALDVIEADPEVRAVILTGAGRAFSAGFDIPLEELCEGALHNSARLPTGRP